MTLFLHLFRHQVKLEMEVYGMNTKKMLKVGLAYGYTVHQKMNL